MTTLSHLRGQGRRACAPSRTITRTATRISRVIFKDAAAHGADLIVTTQKDRVKTGWRDGAAVKIAELRVEFELIRGREAVEKTLDFLVNGVREQAR